MNLPENSTEIGEWGFSNGQQASTAPKKKYFSTARDRIEFDFFVNYNTSPEHDSPWKK